MLKLLEVDPAAVRAGLGARVRHVRQERLRVTLAEFGRQVAEQSGRRAAFSNVTVANWESGRQEPSLASLAAIARLAQLPLCYFAGVGHPDEYPRINWLVRANHANDGQLQRALAQIAQLPAPQRHFAIAAVKGLLEGVQRGTDEALQVGPHGAV